VRFTIGHFDGFYSAKVGHRIRPNVESEYGSSPPPPWSSGYAGSDFRLVGRRIDPRCEYHFPQRGPLRVKIQDLKLEESRLKFRSRSSDDADKSWWNLCGMAGRFRIRPEGFVSGRVLRDRYDKIIRPSMNKSNLDPDQFFPGFFYSLKAGGSYRIYPAILTQYLLLLLF
jgi:hypothetical protein